MAPPDPEAERLAVQRTDDLASITERELKRARALGRKDAEDAQFRSETKEHFGVINGSIAKTADAVEALAKEVQEIKNDLRGRDRVNEALVAAAAGHGARKLTRLQTLGILCGALAALGALAVAVLQALGHS
jgi:hypothetical protein